MALKRRFRSVILGLAVILTFACCAIDREAGAAEGDIMNLPMPKHFVPAKKSDGGEQYIPVADIEKEVRHYSPGLKKFYYNEQIKQFIVPEPSWIIHMLDAYLELLSALGVKGQSQIWDCENYSALLNSLITVKIWQAGYWDTRAALGWMRVNAQKEWAGMPGELHALIFAVTAKGIYIIEPQNGQYTHISKYPNRPNIEEVYLF